MDEDLPPRTPWPPNFPDVLIHTTVKTQDAHPNYAAAKAGDAEAAFNLASDLLDENATEALRHMIDGRRVLLLPVVPTRRRASMPSRTRWPSSCHTGSAFPPKRGRSSRRTRSGIPVRPHSSGC